VSLTPSEQRFTFDGVAELYDRARPRYPEKLIDDLVSLSEIPAGARVLEIGCGTGQLTESLASRGFRMLCLEPGPNLARVARLRLARFPAVEIASQTFEEWPLEADQFALVVSAQAFHWIDPAIRFAKAAAALRAGGSLAVIGNAPVFRASPIRTALDAAYTAHAPGLVGGGVAAGWYGEEGPIRALFDESALFGPVAWRRHPWSQLYSAPEYLDLMRTQSDHRLLPEAQSESLLSAIRAAIDQHGGRFEVNYDAHLYLARRDR
jgi:SAM-dependent methyltransferase